MGLPKSVIRRWYAAGIILSLLALVFAIVANVTPRLGYSLGFFATLAGFFAVVRPAWERPETRMRLILVGGGMVLSQSLILYTGLQGAP